MIVCGMDLRPSDIRALSRGVPAAGDVAATGRYEGTGTILRTVLVADPIAGVPEPTT